MHDHAEHTELHRVVALNECAKIILDDSHQVNLRALDAIVRSMHAGAELRGFATVSQQMRVWSRELQIAVQHVTKLMAERVGLVSRLVKRRRLARLLVATAGSDSDAATALAQVLASAQHEAEAAEEELKRLRRVIRGALEDLQQLGLMACVFSTTALIEASAGSAEQRRDLSNVSKEFGERSEQVTTRIRSMLMEDREIAS